MSDEATLKFILVGNSGVGKSSLSFRLCDNVFFPDYASTIGVDFKYTQLCIPSRGQNVGVQIWDTAGQDTFVSLTSTYYRGAHGVIFCFDLTNFRSFADLELWYRRVSETLAVVPRAIVLGCKQDIAAVGSSSLTLRQVSNGEAATWANAKGMIYMETSAKENYNVGEAFTFLAHMVIKDFASSEKQLPGDRILQRPKALPGDLLQNYTSEKKKKARCRC